MNFARLPRVPIHLRDAVHIACHAVYVILGDLTAVLIAVLAHGFECIERHDAVCVRH